MLSSKRGSAQRLLCAVAGIAASLLSTAGCAHRYADGKASDRVNAILPGYIGPADSYETHVASDSTGALLRGHIRSVHIEGHGVRLQPNLTVAALTLDFGEVMVDPHAGALRSIGSARFVCRISEGDLDRYVRSLRPDIPELSVALPGRSVRVTAKSALIGISAPVSVEGVLTPNLGFTTLNFEPDRAKVSFLPLPGLLLDYLSKRLNPAVDLTNLRVPIRVSRADVHDGMLELTGSVAPDDLMRAAGSTTNP